MSNDKRFLNSKLKRHANAGCDYDYLNKLSESDLAFLQTFTKQYYEGDKGQSPKHKKEANQRRYRAKSADAMAVANYSDTPTAEVDDLDPEKWMLINEAWVQSKLALLG